jgi:hypothetical protein
VHVVAVEGDVQLAEGDLAAAQLLDPATQALREGHAARVDADEGDRGEVGVALDDLVRDARNRLRDRLGIEDSRRCRGVRAQGAFRAMLTFDSFSASRDRVKGVLIGARDYTGVRTATATSHSTR